MGKTTIKMYKADSNGKPFLGQNGNKVAKVTIDKDKDLEIEVSNDFSSSAQITGFTLYSTDGNHGKGSLIGNWNRDHPTNQPSAHIDISVSDNGIVVADSNTGSGDDDFFFSATCTDGNSTYSSDPELIVKKKTGN